MDLLDFLIFWLLNVLYKFVLLIYHKACSEFICEHIYIRSIFEKCLPISNTDFWALSLRIWWEHRVPSPWTLSTCIYNMVLQTGKKLKGPFKGLWVPQKAGFLFPLSSLGVSLSRLLAAPAFDQPGSTVWSHRPSCQSLGSWQRISSVQSIELFPRRSPISCSTGKPQQGLPTASSIYHCSRFHTQIRARTHKDRETQTQRFYMFFIIKHSPAENLKR